MDGACEEMITDLMRASMENDAQKIRACLEEGEDIDAVDDSGRSALMWAAVCASDAALFELLRCGADESLRDYDACTAWDLALQNDTADFYLDALMRLSLSIAKSK